MVKTSIATTEQYCEKSSGAIIDEYFVLKHLSSVRDTKVEVFAFFSQSTQTLD